MIEVLWIDDECLGYDEKLTPMGQEFIEMAYTNNIKITPIPSYYKGIEDIKKNPLKYCAVILDIHNQKATTGGYSDDYDKAKDEIIRIQAINNQKEPYIFTLSGNKLYKTDASTIRQQDYCKKRIYDKSGEDYKVLFEDINKIKDVSKIYACQEQYEDVLKVAKNIDVSTYDSLLKLLYVITIKNERNNVDLINRMRKILEDVMSALKEKGYLFFVKSVKDETLNNLSNFIGKDASIPEYIKRAFHTLVRITQDGSHSESKSSKFSVDSDVANLKAPYLLRSSLFELCNILIWYGDI